MSSSSLALLHLRQDYHCPLTSRFPLVEHRLPDNGQGEEQNAEYAQAAHKHSIHVEICKKKRAKGQNDILHTEQKVHAIANASKDMNRQAH